jgi:hypothetical protein
MSGACPENAPFSAVVNENAENLRIQRLRARRAAIPSTGFAGAAGPQMSPHALGGRAYGVLGPVQGTLPSVAPGGGALRASVSEARARRAKSARGEGEGRQTPLAAGGSGTGLRQGVEPTPRNQLPRLSTKSAKSAHSGAETPTTFRNAIYFHCGGLNLYPKTHAIPGWVQVLRAGVNFV